MIPPTKTAYELFQALNASPAAIYFSRKKVRAFTFNIFEGNLEEIQRACAMFDDPKIAVKLMSVEGKSKGLEFHMEVMRLFHNFLAGAKTLVDHTRTFMEDHYEGTSLKQAYDAKVFSDLANDPLMKFVHDLRNYMLHRGLPNASMTLNLTNDPETGDQTIHSTLSLSSEDLLMWSKWTVPSRAFISSSKKKIALTELTNDYGQKVMDFYKWFDKKLEKHHQSEIASFRLLEKEFELAEQREKAAHQSS